MPLLRELVTHLRKQHLDDTRASNYRWDDQTLVQFLNEGQNQFARATRCFIDDSSDFTVLTTEVGEAQYALDPRIIRVLVVADTNNFRLRQKPRGTHRQTHAGTPLYWEQISKNFVLSPTPDSVITYQLTVERLPLEPMAVMDEDEPEIPSEYHMDLCLYAAAQALSAPDIQVQSEYAKQADVCTVRWGRRLTEARREFYQQKVSPNGS